MDISVGRILIKNSDEENEENENNETFQMDNLGSFNI
jgi:hypothetical protein